MKPGELVVLWAVGTAWLCCQVALIVGGRVPLTDAQTDALYAAAQQAVDAIGFDAVRLLVVLVLAWVAQGVLGAVWLLLVAVEAVRWVRRHPPAPIDIKPEEGA